MKQEFVLFSPWLLKSPALVGFASQGSRFVLVLDTGKASVFGVSGF